MPISLQLVGRRLEEEKILGIAEHVLATLSSNTRLTGSNVSL